MNSGRNVPAKVREEPEPRGDQRQDLIKPIRSGWTLESGSEAMLKLLYRFSRFVTYTRDHPLKEESPPYFSFTDIYLPGISWASLEDLEHRACLM